METDTNGTAFPENGKTGRNWKSVDEPAKMVNYGKMVNFGRNGRKRKEWDFMVNVEKYGKYGKKWYSQKLEEKGIKCKR